mmetsp:Transcript_37590/g.49539  ORF Transcript_37590/g.49539 Transcript_37590/m.49539 type:complete len:95 (-) Transcript_37590:206-490(-)|eukprot:CAMPEP_0117751676 /NCGR_PEP_ID=MMETSP0947-20121206/11122_1 /TAXON_ID=44440 /ORGANISM="Chattonella subsalsa, Strain CCMP2191" /LENGTH=94 /DNA_ID=CAMNT_0005570113 /DNA_START=83 /DNA_END=367 /DNA_ORIENTATION=+
MANANEQNANLEKVTDYVEERQLDSATMMQAVSGIAADSKKEDDQSLFTGKLSKDDIDLIIQEYEVDREKAVLALRKNGADVIQAMRFLLQPEF